MNKSYALLALLLVSAAVLYSLQPQQAETVSTTEYLSYLKKYNKPIPAQDELIYRSKLYAEYVIRMEKHNADPKQTWHIGVNQFSDLTQEEFIATYLGELSSNEGPIAVEEPVNAGF